MKEYLVRMRGSESSLIIKAVSMPALFLVLERQLGATILREVVQITDGAWHHTKTFERKKDGSREV